MHAIIDGKSKEIYVGQICWLGDLCDGTEEEQELLESKCVAVLLKDKEIGIVDYEFPNGIEQDDVFRTWVRVIDVN